MLVGLYEACADPTEKRASGLCKGKNYPLLSTGSTQEDTS